MSSELEDEITSLIYRVYVVYEAIVSDPTLVAAGVTDEEDENLNLFGDHEPRRKNFSNDRFVQAESHFSRQMKRLEKLEKEIKLLEETGSTSKLSVKKLVAKRHIRRRLAESAQSTHSEMAQMIKKEREKRKSKLSSEEIQRRITTTAKCQEELLNYAGSAGALVSFDETRLDRDGGIDSGAVVFTFGDRPRFESRLSHSGKDYNYRGEEILRDDEMSKYQTQAMMEIEKEEKKHDEALKEISRSLSHMTALVGEIVVEGSRQDELIKDIEKAMQRTEETMSNVNSTLKETMAQGSAGPETFCFSFFCCFVIGMLLMIIFNGLAKNK
eukprot:g6410.t1